MLTIRMQRGGRTGHAQFRVIVQDRRTHPKSGRVVAYVGSYNPHTKAASLDKEKIESYLSNGAVPTDRVAKLLTKEGLKLPNWYKASPAKEKAVRNPEKRRSTAPEKPAEEAPETSTTSASETTEDAPVESTPTEDTPAAKETTAEQSPKEESAAEAETPLEPAETPAEEPAPEDDSAEDKPAQ